jgi:hypothetical protein
MVNQGDQRRCGIPLAPEGKTLIAYLKTTGYQARKRTTILQ